MPQAGQPSGEAAGVGERIILRRRSHGPCQSAQQPVAG
jgi:hypothetical protein